jgi:glutaminyl-peptide cyclotransferase
MNLTQNGRYGLALMLNALNIRGPMRLSTSLVLLAFSVVSLTCQSGTANRLSNERSVAKYSYEVVHVYPHDPDAFTQGLIFHDGKLLESTGREGRSSLRSVDLESGQVLNQVDVPPPYFAEGATLLNGKVYQLTWQHHVGFIYDYQSFQRIGQFAYEGQGWGLTTDGHSLILSDGSNRLRFLDPDSFRVIRTIAVTDGKSAINELNELEYVQGEIYANIWHDQRIVTINPQTGSVTSWIDCSGLLPQSGAADEEAVLNGIAFDEVSGRLFVTGKLWPRLFEIKIKR